MGIFDAACFNVFFLLPESKQILLSPVAKDRSARANTNMNTLYQYNNSMFTTTTRHDHLTSSSREYTNAATRLRAYPGLRDTDDAPSLFPRLRPSNRISLQAYCDA